MANHFILNRREWVSHSLAQAGVPEIELVEGDAALHNYADGDGISFCLVDVDLYQPIKAILPKVYAELSPGGIIVVDDCMPHPDFDGALFAYNEFVEAIGEESEIVCEKLGVIRKQPPEVTD